MWPENPLSILQVNTRDIAGGAERVAWDLFRTFREQGHGSRLAVGYRRGVDPDVFCIPNGRASGAWSRFWWHLHERLQPYYTRRRGVRQLCRLAHRLAEPASAVDVFRGMEDFHYPGTWLLPSVTPRTPDVIHCHNLHGNYFDLRVLPSLSRAIPVVLTLHDAWLLSGHCAHSLGCERWRKGCGDCPDLTIYPPIRRDATALNWQRKRAVFSRSRLYLATPCRWLMNKVEASILAPAIAGARILPYGIDLSVFQPADKRAVRAALRIPQDMTVLLFAANGIRRNAWKDYEMLRAAVARLAEMPGRGRILFLALGEDSPSERVGHAEIRFVPYTSDAAAVAGYYQAADVYLHAARAETFPVTILEALACGTPAVATAVGGIAEQIKPLPSAFQGRDAAAGCADARQATGVLVTAGDAAAMAAAVAHLLDDQPLRQRLGENAAADARRRFDLRREAADYLGWYAELLEGQAWPERPPAATGTASAEIPAGVSA